MRSIAATALGLALLGAAQDEARKPNFVIFFTDDQGYNDVGCFGSPSIRTPNLDRMAAEGTRLTSFYAQTVCGPSRTALLTGCHFMRAAPRARGWNLPGEEVTLAEVLKKAGYATGCVGKWDLSGRRYIEDRHPLSQGFDSFFGTLGANDAGTVALMRDREALGPERDMGRLTGLYTEEAVSFIEKRAGGPFFLYLAHTMPHVRIGASEAFRGKSPRGLYGDVIEELDASLGRVLEALRKAGLEKSTVVLFTSDNGPWLSKGELGGSAAPLRAGKGSAWEGGFRVPALLWGPGRIPAGRVAGGMVATLDVLPTFARMAGAELPGDRVLDGRDQSAYLSGRAESSAREEFYYYLQQHLQALRRGRWKIQLPREKPVMGYAPEGLPIRAPQLYDLEADLSEREDVSAKHPDVLRELLELAEKVREDLGDGDRPGKGWRNASSD